MSTDAKSVFYHFQYINVVKLGKKYKNRRCGMIVHETAIYHTKNNNALYGNLCFSSILMEVFQMNSYEKCNKFTLVSGIMRVKVIILPCQALHCVQQNIVSALFICSHFACNLLRLYFALLLKQLSSSFKLQICNTLINETMAFRVMLSFILNSVRHI